MCEDARFVLCQLSSYVDLENGMPLGSGFILFPAICLFFTPATCGQGLVYQIVSSKQKVILSILF